MNGIVLVGRDELTETRAKRFGLQLELTAELPATLPFRKTLVVEAGVRVPFDYLPAAWQLLDRWDAAVPFWKYTETATQIGTDTDREATRVVIRDLRVLLHAVEFMFLQRSEAGNELWATWLEELKVGGDRRLAFLRAYYRVKPKLCVLPTSWLVPAALPVIEVKKKPRSARRLVRVELAPGRFVQVHRGDEERVLEQFKNLRR